MDELLATRQEFVPMKNAIMYAASMKASTALAHAYIQKLKTGGDLSELKLLYRVGFNNSTRLEDLIALRSRRNYGNWPKNLKNGFDEKLRSKMYSRGSSFNSGNFDYQSLASVIRVINQSNNVGTIAGATTYVNSLKRAVNRMGSRVNDARSNENKLARIAGAIGRTRKLSSLTNSIRGAQARIVRLRREENTRRRNRGMPPLPAYSYNNRNRNRERIPIYPQNRRPTSYGNARPAFMPEPNRPQPGVIPMAPPMQAYPSIPVNNRSRPMPNLPQNILPPMEAAAVTNAGGINKAMNLVENAGGASNVVKTANIMRSVGNNAEAAVAAGANAKNVKIVLQLGGAANAIKVASAVPKLKKRRRSKKKKAAPKPPRVKEIKKLIKFLGSKTELLRKLPNPENKEKKLTKNQVVSKITRHLLRKN